MCATLPTMPRTYPPPRTLIAVRLSPGGLAEIDKLAEAADVNRSEMIRRLLAAACNDPRIVRQVTSPDTPNERTA